MNAATQLVPWKTCELRTSFKLSLRPTRATPRMTKKTKTQKTKTQKMKTQKMKTQKMKSHKMEAQKMNLATEKITKEPPITAPRWGS